MRNLIEKIQDYWLSFAGIVAYQAYCKKACYRNRAVVEKMQYKKLKKMLQICQNDIPYYKRLFEEIDFDVERDFSQLSDFKKIPITTKDVVKKHYFEFQNPNYKGKTLQFKTSGSTGMPLQVNVTHKQWIIEQAMVWRHWAWASYRFRDRMAIVRSYAPQNEDELIKWDKIRNFIYYSPFHMTDANMDVYLNHMIMNNVTILRGYPSSIKFLAQYITKTGHDVPRLKAILSASEALSDIDRKIIEDAFETKVSNWYGLAEGIVTMGECERHFGLHNFDEYGYLELLDTDRDGIKRVVGTSLNNYAMPILRYDTRDLALVEELECSCGRSSEIVKNIVGRSSDMIRLADRDIPLTNFYTVMEYYTEIEGWQIIQVSREKVELLIKGDLKEERIREIDMQFKKRLPENVDFIINTEKEFIRTGEGKKVAFISLL